MSSVPILPEDLCLLTGSLLNTGSEVCESNSPILKLTLQGEYVQCIETEDFLPLFVGLFQQQDDYEEFLLDFVQNRSLHTVLRGLTYLSVSCLSIFIQSNWTGPPVLIDPLKKYNIASDQRERFSKFARLSLEVDGLCIYPLLKYQDLLYIAKLILTCVKSQSNLVIVEWWWMRCLLLQQQILEAPSASLKEQMLTSIEKLLNEQTIHGVSQLKALLYVEIGYVYYDILEDKKADEMFLKAQSTCNLNVELTGVLGKRTKFQKEAKSQLSVKITKGELDTSIHDITLVGSSHTPKNISLMDDTVRDTIEYVEPTPDIYTVTSIESLILLGLFENEKRSQSKSTILQEQLFIYIQFLLSQPKLWVVQFVALMWRCQTERKNSRRADRSRMQMEELKNSFSRATPPACERLRGFFATRCPSSWMVEAEFASQLLSVGAAGTALQIYERLELWDEAIYCCQQLGKTHQAESLIRERLAIKETPSLYCFLGDVTGCIDHYEKACTLSGNRSMKAQRCMAYIYFNKQQYNKSMECFRKSLTLNSLQIPVWFTYGCCAMAAEDYTTAVKAFHRCVNLDYDNFEAWSNLSTCYLKLNQKTKAFKVLQDAIKCSYDNWRLWENCLIIGIDCHEFQSSIQAYHRLLDLKGKWIDVEVLSILVDAVNNDLPDASGQPASRLCQKLLELFGRITSKMTNDYKIWRLYAELYENVQKTEEVQDKVLQHTQKMHRCFMQQKNWEKDPDKRKEAALICKKLVLAYKNACYYKNETSTIQHLSSAKMTLRNTLSIIKNTLSLEDASSYPAVVNEQCCTDLDALLEDISTKLTTLQMTDKDSPQC